MEKNRVIRKRKMRGKKKGKELGEIEKYEKNRVNRKGNQKN